MTKHEAENVEKIIARTESHLKKHGWIQNRSVNRNGQCCLSYALGQGTSETGLPNGSDASALVTRLIDEQIPYWNDRPGRTVDEVFTVLAAAKAIAKEYQE